MKAWEIIFGWEDGKTLPKEDGRYYVATYYRGLQVLDIRTLEYTTEHGWNTSRKCTESGFEIEQPYWWTPAIEITPDELITVVPPEQEVTS